MAPFVKYAVSIAILGYLGSSAVADDRITVTNSDYANYTTWRAGRLKVFGNEREPIVLEFENGSDGSFLSVSLMVGTRVTDLADLFRTVRFAFPNRARIHTNSKGAVALDMPFGTPSENGCKKISITVVNGRVFSSQISPDLQSSCLS